MGKCAALYWKTKALLDYIASEHVYDKLGDAGCGGVDPYRSETFHRLIVDADAALKKFEEGMS